MSSPRKTVVPAIPPVTTVDKSIKATLDATKEAVEVGLGRRGDPLDRFVTVRELGDSGIARVNTFPNGDVSVSSPPANPNNGPPGATIFKPGDPNFGNTDYTVPPAPTGVTCSSTTTAILISWNPPNYKNHKYAEVFCILGTSRSQATAALDLTDGGRCDPTKPIGPSNPHSAFIGSSAGTTFVHSGLTPINDPTTDRLTSALSPIPRFYFVRFVSFAGVVGPYAPLNGAPGTLAPDPAAVLAAMTANITNSSIYKQLVGSYVDPGVFANITAAGGIVGYISSQTTVLHGTINQQLINIIGTSDNSSNPTVYTQLSTLNASASANSVSLSNIQQWQSALAANVGAGAQGPYGFANFMSGIYNGIWTNVTNASAIGTQVLANKTQIGSLSSAITNISQTVTNLNGTMSGLWSIQMQQIGAGGLTAAAGFGLSLDTTQGKDGKFTQTSTFLVNANQFAVMGTTGSGSVISYIVVGNNSNTATIYLTSSDHGIVTGKQANFMIATSGVRDQSGVSSANPLATMGLTGLQVNVLSVSGSIVTVQRTDNAGFQTVGSVSSPISKYGNALMPSTNIPFIIDTTRNLIGINGDLVVNGLVNAKAATLGTLTANTGAFMQSLYATVLNAPLIVSNKLVLGAPGSGIYTGGASISNYIVELNGIQSQVGNTTVTNQFLMNYWNPSTGVQNFYLDKNGNMGLGGNLSVGGNAVIATTGNYVTSIGGAGADGTYALWVGAASDYSTNGSGRSESNGLFWIRADGVSGAPRAGFNTDLFLGNDPIAIPSANGNITVKPQRNGQNPTVFVSACVTLIPNGDGTADRSGLGFRLWLVPQTYVGVGSGTVRGGYPRPQGDVFVNAHVGIEGMEGGGTPQQLANSGGYQILETQYDWYKSDVKTVTIQGAIQVPPGDYKAFVQGWLKPWDHIGAESAYSAYFYIQQTRTQ